jgi:hypothetical protein
MANSVNLPAPYGGVDDKPPIAALEAPFCQYLLNFNLTDAGIVLRNGDAGYLGYSLSNVYSPVGFAAYGDSKLFTIYYNNSDSRIRIEDAVTATVLYTSAASGIDYFHTLYFNKYLYFFAESTYAPGVVFNGATIGAIGWTTSTTFSPVGGNVYNNRAYIIQKNAATYWYSGIDAVAGALTSVDLNSILVESSTMAIIAAITLSDNINTVTYQAFVFFSGEVLFYQGSYPDSSNWGLVGRANIGAPLNYNSSINYQGDSLVLCDSGVVSLRDLFLRGSSQAANLTVNTRIQKTWKSYIQKIRTLLSTPTGPLRFISGVYDKVNSRVVISFAYNIDSLAEMAYGSYYFIYDTIRQAWYFHQSYNGTTADNRSVNYIQYFRNAVILFARRGGAIGTYQKEGGTDFADDSPNTLDNVSFLYQMLSAPIPFPKTAVYEATQIEPIIESDLYDLTNWNLIADFGRQTSGDQKTDASTSNVAKPALNVGMQNITFVQVKMSGQTEIERTVGLDLYSYNVWYNSGDTGSR